jgi:hypothetical protein
MRLTSESDPELHKTPFAPRVRDILSHLGVESRFEHSGGNVWTLFTLIPQRPSAHTTRMARLSRRP